MLTRRLLVSTLALLLALGAGVGAFLPTPASAQNVPRHWIGLQGDNGEAVTSGYCRVLTAGTNTQPTIYSNANLSTAASQPLSVNSTSGECQWYMASNTTVDVMVYVTSGAYKGAHVRVDGVNRTSPHRVRISRSYGGPRMIVVPFTATASASATTASESIPQGSVITEAIVEFTTRVSGANNSFHAGIGDDGATANICPSQDGSTETGQAFQRCTISSGLGALTAAQDGALRTHNSNHATGGYVYVYYYGPSNEP